MLKIVLASASPRRKKLLTQLGLIFEIIPSATEEIITSSIPEEVVTDLSLQKATDIAGRVSNALIIGADTIVVQGNDILGKPVDEDDALRILNRLSGTSHSVFTGVSIVITDKNNEVTATHSFYEETKVWFSSLSETELKAYISTGSPMDKAGAYGIQDDWGAALVERIEGDFYNVVGFPLNRFYREMKKLNPDFGEYVSLNLN